MSLESLRRLRHAGKRPSMVNVFVGNPKVEDSPHIVVIDRDPAHLDLSPLVGLPIHLIDIQADESLLDKVMEATQAVGVKVLGAVSSVGACGVSEEHERAMWRYREAFLV